MDSVEIISIGDELLIGQTVNTNASWMGELLAASGMKVSMCVTISDSWDAIYNALEQASKRSKVVLITGGLGPTKDDITKQVLCNFFQTELVLDSQVLKHVESFFSRRNRPMLEVNKMQAMVPQSCKVLFNDMGTAPGMWFEQDGVVFVSMPGVPYEMHFLMEHRVLPELQSRFPLRKLVQKTLLTQGIGESFLADRIADWENSLRNDGLDLAYLPSPGMVKLRITSLVGNESLVQQYSETLHQLLPEHVFGEENQGLSEVVGKLLLDRKQTLGTVESCTGGSISAEITRVSGSSAYFSGSFVTYSNEMKKELVGVNWETLSNFGAVSEEVVCEMALGGKQRLGVDWAIAVSGVAGPTGGSDEKPVGTVWIAIAGPEGVEARRFQFGDNRGRTVQMTVLTALNLLRCKILRINI